MHFRHAQFSSLLENSRVFQWFCNDTIHAICHYSTGTVKAGGIIAGGTPSTLQQTIALPTEPTTLRLGSTLPVTTPFTTTTARTTAPFQATTLPGGTTLSSITGSNLPPPGQSQIFTTTNIPRSRGESRVDFTTLEPRGSTGQSKVPSKALQFSSPSKLISHDYFLSSLSGECFSRRVIPLSTLLTNLINKHPQINPCYLSDYNHAVK